LSFTELLHLVGEVNHGRFGFHLRELKEFVELEPSTKKYRLTDRGKLLAHMIQNFRSVSSRKKIYKEYAGNLASGDHALVLYVEENFKRKILIPFLKAGLLRGEAIVYLVSEHKLDSETREIQRGGIDLENIHKNAFTIMSAHEWYLEKGKAEAKTIITNWLRARAQEKSRIHGDTCIRRDEYLSRLCMRRATKIRRGIRQATSDGFVCTVPLQHRKA